MKMDSTLFLGVAITVLSEELRRLSHLFQAHNKEHLAGVINGSQRGAWAGLCTLDALQSSLGLLNVVDGVISKPYRYPFNNPALSWNERVEDLVGRLTLDEITQQMAYGGRRTHAPGIPRLGIKPYPWGSECLRGDVEAGPATSFPQAIGLAATFSPEVVFNVSRATGLEVRAKFNNYSRHGDYGQHTSASCWSPVINIMRDPRWGRNQTLEKYWAQFSEKIKCETYGEDPYMSGILSMAFVKGLQGDHPRYIMANAGCKHFDVYGGPENIPTSRHHFDAKVSERDLRMTFLPAFKMCVRAGSYSLMCSYNSVNGIPACANKKLLTDVLRKEWGFQGYVISDEGAIEDIMNGHNYTSNMCDTAAAAVNAGTNLEDGPAFLPPYFLAIKDAVLQKKLSEAVVRDAVKPLFYTRMRLGLFDPPKMNPYAQLDPKDIVQNPEHRQLAVTSAMRSFVLLKNTNSFLPFVASQKFERVAILGPMADNPAGIFGGYAPDPDPRYIITPRKALSRLGNSATFEAGCKRSSPACTDYDANAVSKAVTGADLVIVSLGTGCTIECESNDRKDIALPGKQLQLLQDATKFASGAPVILLLFNAGPVDISWAISSSNVKVILECFFPAQAAGEALWRVFHATEAAANPAGRLPATWPASLSQYPLITNYSMEGRTYRYLRGSPLLPFGYGLSYSTYHYRSLQVRPKVLRYTDTLFVDVYVENLGPYDGEEVVQVYVSWTNVSLPTPELQLVGFNRYAVKSGEGISCHFEVSMEQLAVWDDDKGFVTLQGQYSIYAGGQQPNQKVRAKSNVLQSAFSVL